MNKHHAGVSICVSSSNHKPVVSLTVETAGFVFLYMYLPPNIILGACKCITETPIPFLKGL